MLEALKSREEGSMDYAELSGLVHTRLAEVQPDSVLAASLLVGLTASSAPGADILRQHGSTLLVAGEEAHGLAPVALDAHGLMAALNDLACLTARTGVACELQCQAPVDV